MVTQSLSRPLVSVEEYLSTGYEPDCEYNEGVLEVRNVGEFDHSWLQTFLAGFFVNHIDLWGVFALTEQRVQIKPQRFLVPDVIVLQMGLPREQIITRPPFIAIEILSPEDKLRKVTEKAAEYLTFGVEHVWVIDPYARLVYRGTSHGLEPIPSGELAVAGTPIQVRVSELFDKLDRF